MGCSSSKSDISDGKPPQSTGVSLPEVNVPKPLVSSRKSLDPSSKKLQIRSFDSKYTLKMNLGKGRYGIVKVCVDKQTGEEFACKIIDGKAMKSASIIDDEVAKLRQVRKHPNVVEFYDFFKDEDNLFYIVMELCRGGDLFSRIVEDGSYNELRASELLKQLAAALKYIHSLGITHRDLKPENILLSTKGPEAQVKIVDFGLSKMVHDSKLMMTTVIGTWAYCAPEVFSNQPYDNTVDNWAIGILMFIMLSGYHPFDPYGELSDGELISRISNDDFDFDEPEWQGISDDAKFIIRRLLQKDPKKRMTLDAFLNTPWVLGDSTTSADLTNSVKRMASFSARYRQQPAKVQGEIKPSLGTINSERHLSVE